MNTQTPHGEFSNTAPWQSVTISIVGSATETETQDITVAATLERIRDGRWQNPVSKVRNKYDEAYKTAEEDGSPNPAKVAKKKVDPLKKKLPAVTFSGRFEKRRDEGILAHSGLLCIDIDVCDVATMRDKLKSDPYVAAVFVSPTGSGLKALVRTPADIALHERSFQSARRYFQESYSLEIDNCADLSRLCFVSHDPEIFVRNGDAGILEPEPEPEPQPEPQPEPRDDKGEDGGPETAGGYESLPRPCYRVYHTRWHDGAKWCGRGVWFHDRRLTKTDEFDHWICSSLEVLATTTVHNDKEYGRLVEFKSCNGVKKRHILAMRLFAGRGDEALGELLSLGLETARKWQNHVLEYIQGVNPPERYAAALTTGWYGEDIFVLPDEIITLDSHPEKVWYQGQDQESPYGRAGTLEDWQTNIGALASGNIYLIGAICAGFAGPLLYKCDVHGAIIHYFGPSTTGKTTCLSVGASAWGAGGADGKTRGFIRTWQSTAVGIEAFASLHSDTLGILDELHLVDPKVLDQASYAVANGCGKSRGNVHASMRPTKHWRVFGLSSGEASCDTWLRSGGITVRAGQAVRMLDVPVYGAVGAFDNLHGFPGGKVFAEELNRNTLRCYGHAGPAFVRKLIEENPNLNELLSGAARHFSPSEGEPALNPLQARAARTFAIMAVAGELGARWGIVPWMEGEAINACVLLFRRWMEQIRASGLESPDTKILKLIASYISRFADSRFSSIEGASHEGRVNDRSGYWKDEAHPGGEDRRIFLFTSEALQEAAKGYDIHHISAALKAAGALSKTSGDGQHLAVSTRTPHVASEWLYHINPENLQKH